MNSRLKKFGISFMAGSSGIKVVGPLVVALTGISLLIVSMAAVSLAYLRQKGILQIEDRWPLGVSVAIGIAGVMLASWGSKRLARARDFLKLKGKLIQVGKKVMGNVISITPHFIYEFPVGGRKFQGISESGDESQYAGLFLGSAIEILYNPANPEENMWTGH
ncbi:MAG: hypothetical protein K2X47_19540 [Bdellovibrionales bacterium]|nr:hypothetical protein [Bdellovibrionales bacterium]